MSSPTNKRTFLCSDMNNQNQQVYLTYFPDSNKWKSREVSDSEKLIEPSLLLTNHKLANGEIVFQASKKSASRFASPETIYLYQTVESLLTQVNSLNRLIQTGAASWFKVAHLQGIEKAILLKTRTGRLNLTPEIDKLYSVFEKCVALTKSDKIGEQENAYQKAVLIGMKILSK